MDQLQSMFNRATDGFYQFTLPFFCKVATAQNKLTERVRKEFRNLAPDQSRGIDYKGTDLDYKVKLIKNGGQLSQEDRFESAPADEWRPYGRVV